MAKNKNKNNTKKSNQNIQTQMVPIELKGNTILEEFQNYFEKHKKVSDIIRFLSVKNAQLIGLVGTNNVTKEMENQVLEFYKYFTKNFDEVTAEARYENWPNDAYILRAGESLYFQALEQEHKEFLRNVSDEVKDEAKDLRDVLIDIRKHKILTVCTKDDKFVRGQFPKTITKRYLNNAKNEMLYLCAYMLENYGSMIVRIINEDETAEIFGLRTDKNKHWQPLSKEQTYDCYTLSPSGDYIEPEEGVTFTEIKRIDYSMLN